MAPCAVDEAALELDLLDYDFPCSPRKALAAPVCSTAAAGWDIAQPLSHLLKPIN
jgi:hypothetical protein